MPVAALAARAKGAAGMVATSVVVVVAAARVDGDVAAAGGAVAVAEGGHCDGGDGVISNKMNAGVGNSKGNKSWTMVKLNFKECVVVLVVVE